jgi:microfibrillar-associated protein 1
VFVPRGARATIDAAAAADAQADARWEQATVRDKARKEDSRALVAESIRREAEALGAQAGAADSDAEGDLPDDADDLEDPVEFESWKVRELKRWKRDTEERRRIAAEAAETDRRRAMTEEERDADDRRLGIGAYAPEKEKAQWKFLQKYHHKGAFYMDDDSIGAATQRQKDGLAAEAQAKDVRSRAVDGATGEDNFNFAALPKVLQVKNFGLKGRTKYTHLADQDTTDYGRDKNYKSSHSKCNNCGLHGHDAYSCPTGAGAARAAEKAELEAEGVKCFNCGEEGHMSRECPNRHKRGDREHVQTMPRYREGQTIDVKRRAAGTGGLAPPRKKRK